MVVELWEGSERVKNRRREKERREKAEQLRPSPRKVAESQRLH